MTGEGPERRKPTHGVIQRLNNPVIVFVTVCTESRKPWLAVDAYHDLLLDVWRNAERWMVGRYVIMPDHLHFFAAPHEPDFPFENWMKYWRSQFAKRNPVKENRFQSDHRDRRLRSGESYREKWVYMSENPVRKGMVERAEDWPYSGEVFELRW